MQVRESLYDVLFYGAIAVSLVAVVALRVRPQVLRFRAELPDARVVGGSAPAGQRSPLVWIFVALFGGASAAYALHRIHTPVIVISDDGGGLHVTRYAQLGHLPPLALAPDVTQPEGDVTWVVNESTHTTSILKTVAYGSLALPAPDPIAIPPGTAAYAHGDIDYIGPLDIPPNTVTVEGMRGEPTSFDIRHWLTWHP